MHPFGLWMQWLILQVLQCTRAATSNGPDLDSWMADMTLTRLPAVDGDRTCNPFPVHTECSGTYSSWCSGSHSRWITEFLGNRGAFQHLWNQTLNGFTIPAGVAGLSVPVVAVVAGAWEMFKRRRSRY